MNTMCMLDYQVVAKELEHHLNLFVKLTAPKATASKRKPLNLGLVIDRSGSMSGEKLAHAKSAMKMLITHLSSDDLLTIVTFDSSVDVVMEPTAVQNKDALKTRVDTIQVGGNTNLSGGWIKGIELVGSKASPDRINRILILTDGQVNEGIVAPEQLTSLGASALTKGIATTTLGFGADFQEDLLTAVAQAAGGKFYYIESADMAPTVFREELEGLLALVAQNIELRIDVAAPVAMLRQWTDYPAEAHGRSIRFKLGDAYSEEEKSVLLQLLVPAMKYLGPAKIADLKLSFAEIADGKVTLKEVTEEIQVNVTTEEAAKATGPKVEVLQQLALQMAAEARRDAIKQADGGDYDAARNTLGKVCEKLSSMPIAGEPQIRAEIEDMQSQAGSLRAAEYGSTRKNMRSAAYNIGTSNFAKLQRERERRRPPSSPTSSPA
jgi:Ca-activated chloride channel family protein